MRIQSVLIIVAFTPLFLLYNNGFVSSQSLKVKKEYWKNGHIRLQENYKTAQLEGLSRYFYENGIKMSEINYKNGKISKKGVKK